MPWRSASAVAVHQLRNNLHVFRIAKAAARTTPRDRSAAATLTGAVRGRNEGRERRNHTNPTRKLTTISHHSTDASTIPKIMALQKQSEHNNNCRDTSVCSLSSCLTIATQRNVELDESCHVDRISVVDRRWPQTFATQGRQCVSAALKIQDVIERAPPLYLLAEDLRRFV